jgi:serine/threonine-protein kinase
MSRAQGVVKRPSEVLTQVAGHRGSIDEPPDYEPASILGTTLGVYRLDGILGSGAVGVVYKAWDTRCNRIVALKLLRAGLLATVDDRRRFRQEALALGRLSHANVTTILDFGSAYGRDYLVMEFVPGQTLSELLDGEPMASGQVAYLGQQLANGLEAAHLAGVVHRDIKPQNLRLTPDGQLKILDFGLARDDTPERAQDTSEGGIVGTIPYMAPEQLGGDRVGPRTDVYGAGAVLYELACGRRPFVADTVESLVNMIRYETPPRPSAINPSIWPSLEAVIVRALAKEPDARVESARALALALSRVCHDRAVRGSTHGCGLSALRAVRA